MESTSTPEQKDPATAPATSAIISWGNAQPMICKYMSAPLECVKNAAGDPIFGFSFDKEDMERLIRPTFFPRYDPAVDDAKALMMMFGKKSTEALTVLFVRLDTTGRIMEDVALEYCLPCPTTCPKNMDIQAPDYICRL